LQISAPVQPGNSGGPLLDTNGHLVGIVTAKLNAVRTARFTGDVPQNVNFAIKGEIARAFLDSKGINYQTAQSNQNLSVAEVGDGARPFTVFVECKRAAPRTTAIKHPPNQPPPTQKSEEGSAQIANAANPLSYCKSDVARLCPGIVPGGGKLIGCLKERENEISVGCAKALAEIKKKMGR
jgi:hypothetical protein